MQQGAENTRAPTIALWEEAAREGKAVEWRTGKIWRTTGHGRRTDEQQAGLASEQLWMLPFRERDGRAARVGNKQQARGEEAHRAPVYIQILVPSPLGLSLQHKAGVSSPSS